MIATPIYDAVIADHGDVLNYGAIDEGGSVPNIPTPLLDDVAEHGIGPWDDARRKALGSATVNLVRKSPMPPRPRARKAAPKARGKR